MCRLIKKIIEFFRRVFSPKKPIPKEKKDLKPIWKDTGEVRCSKVKPLD